jgi:hypothetical protein
MVRLRSSLRLAPAPWNYSVSSCLLLNRFGYEVMPQSPFSHTPNDSMLKSMPDEPKSRAPLVFLAVVLLVCGVAAAWLILKLRHENTENKAPVAALRLDSLDETNRVATVSDGGSHDPDGAISGWRIAWGDGEEENLSSIPQKRTHTYAAEGKYTISLWCVDNLGAASSTPAMTNITLDFLQRQKELEAEAKREADRLKAEAATKEAERLEQERKELAAREARKAKEQQELEEKRKADELARKNAKVVALPPRSPVAAGLEDPFSRKVIFTPPGFALGDFLISKEKTEGIGHDGNLQVILTTRCINFPETPIPTADWQIDGNSVKVRASRIRASLSAGEHQITAVLMHKEGDQTELKADVTVQNGDCVVIPRK